MAMLVRLFMLVVQLIVTLLIKLRLLPAFIYVAVTSIWFSEWAESIGWMHDGIAIALIAIGLGSFVVQGIIKLRDAYISSKLEAEYEAQRERELLDELLSTGKATRIN